MTVEHRSSVGSEEEGVNRVVVYRNWRNSKAGSSVRVHRVCTPGVTDSLTQNPHLDVATDALLLQSSSNASISSNATDKSTGLPGDFTNVNHAGAATDANPSDPGLSKNLSNRSQSAPKKIEMNDSLEAFQITGSPSCIAVDENTGTIGVVNKYKVSLYQFSQSEGNANETTLKCIVEISVSFIVSELSISEEFICCRSDSEVQVIQFCISSQVYSDALTTDLLERNPEYHKHKAHYNFISDYLNHHESMCASIRNVDVYMEHLRKQKEVKDEKLYIPQKAKCTCKVGSRESESGLWATPDPCHINIMDSLKQDNSVYI